MSIMKEKEFISSKEVEKKSGDPKSEMTEDSHRFAGSPFEPVLSMQRTIGNKLVGELLSSGISKAGNKMGRIGDNCYSRLNRQAAQVMKLTENKAMRQMATAIAKGSFSGSALGRPKPTVQRQAKQKKSKEKIFLDDLESGTRKAKEYVDYVSRCIEWAQKYNRDLPERVKDVAKNLRKISQTLSDGLGKFAGAVENVEEGLEMAGNLYTLAAATSRLDLTQGNLEAWLDAVESVNDSAQTLQGWLKGLAMSSPVWARAHFVIGILHAYIEIGVAAVKSVKKSLEYKIERIEKAHIERRQEPPPEYPGDWKTEAELSQAQQERQKMKAAATQALIESAKRKSQFIETQFEVQCPEIREAIDERIYARLHSWLSRIEPWKSGLERETVAASLLLDIIEEKHKKIDLVPGKTYIYSIKLWLPLEGETPSWDIIVAAK